MVSGLLSYARSGWAAIQKQPFLQPRFPDQLDSLAQISAVADAAFGLRMREIGRQLDVRWLLGDITYSCFSSLSSPLFAGLSPFGVEHVQRPA